jgi:hypothetical protein
MNTQDQIKAVAELNNMQSIDWRAEALEFARQNDTRNHMVIQHVELAMKRGAEILTAVIAKKIIEARIGLEKQHELSAPHSNIIKPIKLDHETT